MNETHDPVLRSWVQSANETGADFSLQNLPFGVFRRKGSAESFGGGVAIGDQIVDLHAALQAGAFAGVAQATAVAASQSTLSGLMAMGPLAWGALRQALSCMLRIVAPAPSRLLACLVPQADAEYDVPARIGDYTDFYTSIHHATNIGRQFRPDNPLLPNYKWIPIGYHGRSSSIGISGESVVRPVGQVLAAGTTEPVLSPSRRLDVELELGIFIGPGNPKSTCIDMADADAHAFGFCLLNDWSARDLQGWEYQPLGPFLSKNFATTISPWIVTMEALAPYRVPFSRPVEDPQPLAYLDSPANRAGGAIDIQLRMDLQTRRMRSASQAGVTLCTTSYRHAYWTLAQLIAHHTVNGCNLQPGDLLGTGTLSGPTAEEATALIEITQGGKNPLKLPGDETRSWLEDGNAVTLRGGVREARSGAHRVWKLRGNCHAFRGSRDCKDRCDRTCVTEEYCRRPWIYTDPLRHKNIP